MNTLQKILARLAALIPLMSVFTLGGEDLPSYLQRSSRSRGQLTMSVETLQDSLPSDHTKRDELELMDDLAFHVEAGPSVQDAIPTPEPKVEESFAEQITEEASQYEPEKSQEAATAEMTAFTPVESVVGATEDETTEDETTEPEPSVDSSEPELTSVQEAAVQQAEEQDEEVVFNFENADLSNLVAYIENLFGITFIPDDVVKPVVAPGLAVEGNKISFKTQKPLNKQQAWSLFLTFLDMAGLAVVQQANPKIFRIVSTDVSKKSALQSFIGIDSELLPDNDTKIRYVYFVKDTPIETLTSVIEPIKSHKTEVLILQELKAFIMIGSAYNIKSLMRIIRELDKVSMPQSMSVLKLRRVDAKHVEQLYKALTRTEQPQRRGARIFRPRKSATTLYFPEDMQMIVEPRTNSLILLGTDDEIKKVENFILKNIDVDAGTPYSPLHVYELKHADATVIAQIMNDISKFGGNTVAGRVGGVRGEDKFVKQLTFTAETSGNRLIIRGDYEDYLNAKEVLDKLDEPQPQVAVEVLILSVGLTGKKELGTQWRNSPRADEFAGDGLLGKNINFQTSGIHLGGVARPIVQNTGESGAKRLLGDLIELVTGATPGNTILSLGSDAFGVWGIFHALKSVSNLQVISNPFLIATNKTPAKVMLGETRRVETATIEGTKSVSTYGDKRAELTVDILPQINSDGMVILDLTVEIVEFRDDTAAAVAATARTTKKIKTTTVVADKEVLALGGLIKNKTDNNESKFPVLGKIPLLGWLFRNKSKSERKEDLLVLISARIIDPTKKDEVDKFTAGHIQDYKSSIAQMEEVHLRRDPIDRAFFSEPEEGLTRKVDNLLFERGEPVVAKRKRRKRGKKRVRAARKKAQTVVASAPRKRRRRKKIASARQPTTTTTVVKGRAVLTDDGGATA